MNERENNKMPLPIINRNACILHWEYPSYAIITTLYIPILSGAVK